MALFDRTRAVGRGFGEDFLDPNRGVFEKAGTLVRGTLATVPAIINDIVLPPAAAAGTAVQSVVRGVTGQPPAPTTPAPTTPPPAAPAVARAPQALGVTSTGVPGIRRITNPVQPDAAPLFTNIADTAVATRGFYDEPALSPASVARTIATSSVFQDARDQRAANLAQGAREFEQREAEARTAADLSAAQGAIGRGITRGLRTGLPAKLVPELAQALGFLQQSNAKAAPAGLDVGDLAALTNAQTGQGQLEVAQSRLAQTAAADAARSTRAGLNAIAELSKNPNTGLVDPSLYDQNLIQYGPLYGLGGDTTALDVAADTADKLRKTGRYTEAEIQQIIKQRYSQ